MIKGKKGVSIWISWVLITGFVIALSVFMFNWIGGFTKANIAKMERVTDAADCSAVGLRTEVCQNTQTLYINLTNTKDIEVQRVIFRLYDIYDNPDVKKRNITLRPGDENTEEVLLVKQGTIKRVEVIPLIVQGTSIIQCRNKMDSVDSVPFCR